CGWEPALDLRQAAGRRQGQLDDAAPQAAQLLLAVLGQDPAARAARSIVLPDQRAEERLPLLDVGDEVAALHRGRRLARAALFARRGPSRGPLFQLAIDERLDLGQHLRPVLTGDVLLGAVLAQARLDRPAAAQGVGGDPPVLLALGLDGCLEVTCARV